MSRIKLLWVAFATISGLLLGAYGLYSWGYSAASTKFKIIVGEQKARIEVLEAREDVVETVVVTEYKDRIKTITKVEEKIIEVIRNGELSQESSNCHIGPVFIGLHNAAASDTTISRSTDGTDAGTAETKKSGE